MSKIRIEQAHFNMIMKIAQNDFERYEEINKSKKEVQCFNSINSCRIGVLSEFATKIHFINTYKEEIININSFGLSERLQEKHFRSKPDIQITTVKKDYLVEVKGITKGQPRGQILPFHADKYFNNNFTHVVFCEVEYNELECYADIEIYLIDKIENVLKYPLSKNKYGKPSYTHPEFLYMSKAH